VFSLAPALGATIGILLTELSFTADIETRIELPLQILQAVATGTIVYVVFFEIIPKGKQVGGTGKQHIAAMILGFALFLPSLYFHSDHEHGEEGGAKMPVGLFLANSSIFVRPKHPHLH